MDINYQLLLPHEKIVLRMYAQELKKETMPPKALFLFVQKIMENNPKLSMHEVPND